MSESRLPLKVVLGWISGVMAVISLVLGVAALNRAVSDWRDARATVNQVVAGADAALAASDFRLAKSGYDEAMRLDPTSPELRAGRTQLSLQWIRVLLDDIREGETPASLASPLLPNLYRALESAKVSESADLWAHIGRGQHFETMGRAGGRIRRDEVAAMLAIYASAIELDPAAFRAYLYRGLLHLERPADIAAAGMDFERAIERVAEQHGEDSDEYRWVRRLVLHALVNRMSDLVLWDGRPEEHAGVLLDWLVSMRAAGEALPDRRYVDRILSFYRKAGQNDEQVNGIVDLLPVAEHRAMYQWLLDGEVGAQWLAQQHNQLPLMTIEAAMLESTDPVRAEYIYLELKEIDWLSMSVRTMLDARIQALGNATGTGEGAAPKRGYVSDPVPVDDTAYAFHLETLENFDVTFEPPNADAAFRYFREQLAPGREQRRDQLDQTQAVRRRIFDEFLLLKSNIGQFGYTSEYSKGAEISATRNLLRARELVARSALRDGRYDNALAEIDDAEAICDEWVPGWIFKLRARALSARNAAGDLAAAASALEQHIAAEVRYGGALNWNEVKSDPDFASLRATDRYAEIMRGR